MSKFNSRHFLVSFVALCIFFAAVPGVFAQRFGQIKPIDDNKPASFETQASSAVIAESGSKTIEIPELVGEIVPYRKVALCPKVNGRLVQVPLFSGDLASEGSAIAVIDPRDFELNVAQAKAALEVLKARLKLLETGSRPEEKKQALEAVKQAEANMENARADFLRISDLFTAGAISKQALDAAEAKKTVTQAQWEGAVQQRSVVEKGPREEEKEATRAQIRQQEASLELARLQLDYASLRAPFQGIVSMRHLDEGAYVTTNTPVYTILQIDPLFAVVDCPERFFPLLNIGAKADVTVDALPGKIFHGTLLRVPPSIDSKNRAARLEITINNPEFTLKPGMFARATFVVTPAIKP